jgi:hypothetical protein
MSAIKSKNTLWRGTLWLGACLSFTGCANMYVDTGTPEVQAAAFKKPKTLHPVQVQFEFQTKDVANARATEFLKTRVTDQVAASGLFSGVSESPAPGGSLLSITLNNVPLTDDAASKGFVTGLTFGAKGSQVSDGYICTVRYSGGMGVEPIVKQARHAIHTTLGSSPAPANAVKAENPQEAVTTMTRQVVSHVLNDLSQDGAFK